MDEQIKKVINALPDEALDELNLMLDGDFDEKQIQELFEKYNINVAEVLADKEAE